MTQAHKQQYKYKVTSNSFKNKNNRNFNLIIPVILFAVIYLIARV